MKEFQDKYARRDIFAKIVAKGVDISAASVS